MSTPRRQARRLSLARLQGAAIVAVMLAVILTAIVLAGRSITATDQFGQEAARATQQIAAADGVLDALQDAETAERGFLLTGRVIYLAPYQHGQTRLEASLDSLSRLAADSPWLGQALPDLRRLAEARFADLARTLVIAREQGTAAAVARMLDDHGRAAMDAVRARVARIDEQAEQEREAGTAAVMENEHATLAAIGIAALTGALLLGFTALGFLFTHQRRQRAQTALATQTARLASTIELVRDGLAVFDADDRLLLWNRSFFAISGIDPVLAVPGTPYAAIAAATEGWQPPLLSDPRPPDSTAGSTSRRGGEVRAGDRAVLEVWRSATPEGGQMIALADITRRTRAEAIAGQAQKMEAMGQLTGGVAHDFNNLLHVVAANLDLLATSMPGEPGPAQERLGAARAAVARGASLTRQLLTFARREPLRATATDPAARLRAMEDLLGQALDRTITVTMVLDPVVAAISVDPHQLENALLNLAINARDAIRARHTGATAGLADGGRIEISVADVATLHPVPGIDGPVPPGRYVRIAVSDTGAGMSEAVIARAIDPFFTTKPVGKGSGLGLSQVYGFVRQSGGHLRIDSVPGVGTTVALLLPALPGFSASRPAAPAQPEAAPPPPLPETRATPVNPQIGGLRVLVIEDDAEVAAMAGEMLAALGHCATQAQDGASARAIVAQGFDLLMIDRGLPDGDGVALAGALTAILPDAAVLIASGAAAECGSYAWLGKPYDLAALRDAIAAAEARPKPAPHAAGPG